MHIYGQFRGEDSTLVNEEQGQPLLFSKASFVEDAE